MSRATPDAFVMADFRPAYLAPEVQRSLSQRAATAREQLRCCRACPRDCQVDRLADETDFCRIGRDAIVSSAFAHSGEEG